MALYIPHSIFHSARLFYVRPETFGRYYVAKNSLVTGTATQCLRLRKIKEPCAGPKEFANQSRTM